MLEERTVLIAAVGEQHAAMVEFAIVLVVVVVVVVVVVTTT